MGFTDGEPAIGGSIGALARVRFGNRAAVVARHSTTTDQEQPDGNR